MIHVMYHTTNSFDVRSKQNNEDTQLVAFGEMITAALVFYTYPIVLLWTEGK